MADPKWTPKTLLAAGVGAGLVGGAALLGGWMLAGLFAGLFDADDAPRQAERLPVAPGLFDAVQESRTT